MLGVCMRNVELRGAIQIVRMHPWRFQITFWCLWWERKSVFGVYQNMQSVIHTHPHPSLLYLCRPSRGRLWQMYTSDIVLVHEAYSRERRQCHANLTRCRNLWQRQAGRSVAGSRNWSGMHRLWSWIAESRPPCSRPLPQSLATTV